MVTVLLAAILGFLVFHWRTITTHEPMKEPPVPVKNAELPPSGSSPPAMPSVYQNHPSGSKMFLQVGAMTHEDNAVRLATSLSTRGFPAFVSHTGTDRFYLVLIGPYEGSQSALRVREELKKQNLDSVVVKLNAVSRQKADEP